MRNGLEVADVFRDGQSRFVAQYGHTLRSEQRQVLAAIIRCRTAELGGHVQRCDECGHQRIQYNSCRNRHCPKCQATARAAWLEARQAELLPIPYFHVVFTLPEEIRPLALQNKRVVYGILFRAAAETLQKLAANPKHLGAEIGLLAVLHTWGQNLMHHPHLHCVVTGGGLAPGRSRWILCRQSGRTKKLFFFPVRILSRVFRGKIVDLLKRAYGSGKLHFHGKLASLVQPTAWQSQLDAAVKKDWVVYAKRPFGGPQRVLKYLARYTHRVAISNQRLIELRDGQVSFQYKDYADGQQTKVMKLASSEFIRRFLMHTLPNGFVRIRYYGFLSNRDRHQRLDRCRRLLGAPNPPTQPAETAQLPAEDSPYLSPATCPICKRRSLVIIDVVPAITPWRLRHPHFLIRHANYAACIDTS
jgi:predicted Zn-ribbon and HTH transcriptional regulator